MTRTTVPAPGAVPGQAAVPATGVVSEPPLVQGGVDRVAHRRRDPEWLAQAWSRARILLVDDGRTLVRAGEPALALFGPGEVPIDAERYLLGVDAAGEVYFAVRTPLPELPGTRPATLRDVGEALDADQASLFVTAVALAYWHAGSRYSPRSGRPTTVGEAGWTRTTDDAPEAAGPAAAGNGPAAARVETVWPRTDPAVIVLVHDGVAGDAGRCLLASNLNWQTAAGLPRYSCLAGFVEPGESAEQTVAREIGEEVGVTVRDIRYVTSQPWPFPRSLMLGFTALADPAEALRLDGEEIAAARWFTRTEVAAALTGEGAGFGLPMGVSVARYLIARWVAGD